MKQCGRCGVLKPFAEFQRRGQIHQSWCKGCRKEYDAAAEIAKCDLVCGNCPAVRTYNRQCGM